MSVDRKVTGFRESAPAGWPVKHAPVGMTDECGIKAEGPLRLGQGSTRIPDTRCRRQKGDKILLDTHPARQAACMHALDSFKTIGMSRARCPVSCTGLKSLAAAETAMAVTTMANPRNINRIGGALITGEEGPSGTVANEYGGRAVPQSKSAPSACTLCLHPLPAPSACTLCLHPLPASSVRQCVPARDLVSAEGNWCRSDQVVVDARAGAFKMPIDKRVSAMAATAPGMPASPKCPMQPMRKVSTSVSLPG